MLTGRVNYSDYWLYRGWLKKIDFDDSWWLENAYINQDVVGMKCKAAIINDPQKISAFAYNCIDTGAYFIRGIKPNTIREIDKDSEKIYLGKDKYNTDDDNIIKNVSLIINGGENGLDSRRNFIRLAKRKLI